ncbi:MAG: DNA polymerase III subunit alpha [Caldilineaceae bacterium]
MLGGIFDARTYLALELHTPADHDLAVATADLGARFGLPTVAVQPVYCLERSHQPRLRLLTAIDRNCRLEDVPADALPDANDSAVTLHWQTPGEMASRFANFPDALAMTHTIAAQCQPALPDGRPVWPVPHLPAATTPTQALRTLAEKGLAKQYGATPDPAIVARLDRELAAIDAQGFTPLFLVVADVVGYAREKGVPVSTRGSVADSLAAFCVGITTVDPVRHDLLFERFLNPARASLPDIDLDCCSRRRDEVLEYVRRRYGEEETALVATISTMKPKSAVRETAKAYGLDDAAITRLVKLLPGGWHPDPRRRDKRGVDDVLAKLDDPHLRHVIRAAYELVSQPHHMSIHPGGVVITPGPVTDYAPVQWTVKGFRITQFDHGDVEAIGLPKLDLLGIRALTVLADAAALVQAHHALDFTLEAIPLDDAATGDLLARAETVGVFQCESTGAQRTLRQLKARTVQDLAVANAFFKPGPATGGMAQTFVRRYRGEEPTRYLHPALEPVLHTTKGVLIFQEQVLRIATEIAGLTWAEADHLRRGMSKFQPEEMTAMRARFVAGCRRPAPDGPGFAQGQAETLWQQVEAFAGYGFNQGHATAYADVSYRSAYLKAHWPAAFLCARLQDWGGFHHQAIYIAEAQRLGIAVRPPHVNHSGRKFTLTFDADAPVLWMGLGQVRDLRRQAVAGIIAARREHPFTGVRDLLLRVELQAKEVRHLIQCGALDGLGASRAAMLAEAGDLSRAGSAAQMAFDFGAPAVPPEDVAARLDWERHILACPSASTPPRW